MSVAPPTHQLSDNGGADLSSPYNPIYIAVRAKNPSQNIRFLYQGLTKTGDNVLFYLRRSLPIGPNMACCGHVS
jgi:hypothetical protein